MKNYNAHVVMMAVLSTVLSSINVWASSVSCHTEFGGERLSVSADKVTLGKLLAALGKQTGVHFQCSELTTRREIVIDCNGLHLQLA